MLPVMKTPPISVMLQQKMTHSLQHYLQLANQHFRRSFAEPALHYQQRGTAAGTAWLERWEIRLNPLLLQENVTAFADEVIPHELAHLLVWKLFGRVAPHGKEWKWMMETVLGVPARRTHQFALTSVQTKTFPYYCQCQQHHLTLRRHNRILRGASEYRCVKCGVRLQSGTLPVANLLPVRA